MTARFFASTPAKCAYECPLAELPDLTGLSTNAPAYTLYYGWDHAKMTLLGADWYQVGANARAGVRTTDKAGDGGSEGYYGQNGSIFFETDDPAPVLRMIFDVVVIYVDQMDGLGWQYAGSKTSGNAAIVHYLTIDWTGVTKPRRMRKYRIEVGYSMQFYSVYTGNTSMFRRYRRRNPKKAVHIADSWGGHNRSYASYFGMLLGFEDYVVSGSGGTGLIQTNGTAVNYADRLQVDLIDRAPDVVFVQMSKNDNGQSIASLETAFDDMVATIRAGLPQAELNVIGVWGSPADQAAGEARNDAFAARADALGVRFLDWFDLVTGTGNVSNPQDDGTADNIISADNTHPENIDGTLILAKALADIYWDLG